MDNQAFEAWAIVEVFGHQRFAGRVTEQSIGGCSFVRVDVPDLPELNEPATQYTRAKRIPAQPAFTKLFSQGAIYSITPVDERVARAAAAGMRAEPVNVYMPAQIPAGSGEDED